MVQPPPGLAIPQNHVWRLKKSLYGLKQAPLNFYNKMKEVLDRFGLKNTMIEPCLFFNDKIKIILYVDYGLIFGKMQDIKEILAKLQDFFTVKVIEFPQVFLGITISKLGDGSLHLDLSNYLSKIQKENNITPSFKSKVPMSSTYDICNDNTEKSDVAQIKEFQKIIGILTYCTSTIRGDLCYPINLLARKLKAPTQSNLQQAKKVLSCEISTKFKGINYQKNKKLDIKVTETAFMKEHETSKIELNNKLTITTITDATWADSKDRTSNHGYITFLENNMISWKSQKVSSITLSTSESELIALCYGTRHALFVRNLLREFNMSTNPINIINDNQSALMMGTHRTGRNKHIKVKFFFTRQLVEANEIKLHYIQTKENISDPLTKNLYHSQYNLLMNKIMN